MGKILYIVIILVFTGACQDDSYQTRGARSEADALALPSSIYGACDAYVVADRDKDIDISSDRTSADKEFFRPAVFQIKLEEDIPDEVEILMLASSDDSDNPLYPNNGSLLSIFVQQQSDLLLKDGEREVNRYRGNSALQRDSIEIDWYAEADTDMETGTELVVRVDFASDPYDNDGVRRWGKHYVCHRNAGIAAIDADTYAEHVEQATPPSTSDEQDR